MDVYRGETPAASLVDVAILQAFFPHIVAGPIVRADELLHSSDPARPARGAGRPRDLPDRRRAGEDGDRGRARAPRGGPGLQRPDRPLGLELALAFYGFAAQIYCDFSGYTDMAIGLALLLGYQLPRTSTAPTSRSRSRTSGGAGT